MNYNIHYTHGSSERLQVEDWNNVSLSNTIFSTRSGEIKIGKGVLFAHGCMVLTGKHDTESKDLIKIWDVMESGRDIAIGEGCFIGGAPSF